MTFCDGQYYTYNLHIWIKKCTINGHSVNIFVPAEKFGGNVKLRVEYFESKVSFPNFTQIASIAGILLDY